MLGLCHATTVVAVGNLGNNLQEILSNQNASIPIHGMQPPRQRLQATCNAVAEGRGDTPGSTSEFVTMLTATSHLASSSLVVRLTTLLLLFASWATPARAQPPPIGFTHVLYFVQEPRQDLQAALRKQPPIEDGSLEIVDAFPDSISRPVVLARVIDDVAESAPPPSVEILQLMGKGISKEQARDLQSAARALALTFVHPEATAVVSLDRADRIVADLAASTGAMVYDVESRYLYSSARWREERLGAGTERAANALRQIAVHSYKDGEHVRSVSVGMAKFGLPDLVIQEMTWGLSTPMGLIMVGIAQRMIEGQQPTRDGQLELDLQEVLNPEVREYLSRDVFDNATRRAMLKLVPAPMEEGDADNALLAIDFGAFPGPDEFARQSAASAAMFGWSDAVKSIDHDAELLAASEKARAALPALRAEFAKGLDPGAYIQVKLPFEVPAGGREWMWVEVHKWSGDQVEGMLLNEPFDIPTLSSGQIVEGRTQDIFDYIRVWPDGRQEGNATGLVIERMQGATREGGGE